MTTLNDLGNKNLKELSRVYNFEVNTPYVGNCNILLRREKLFIVDNSVISQTQLEPIIKKYNTSAKNTVTIFDPITRKTTTISILALIDAIQKIEQ